MMIALTTYSFIFLIFLFSYTYSNRMVASLAAVPLIFCGYFLVSTFLFSFGSTMPYDYFDIAKDSLYLFVTTAFCLHFLAVILAFYTIEPRRATPRPTPLSCHELEIKKRKPLQIGLTGAAFCASPVFFILMSSPIEDLYSRNQFILASAHHGWMRFADLAFFSSAVLTPFIRNPLFKYAILFFVFLAYLSLGSRSAVIFLVLFSTIDFFALRRRSVARLLFFGFLSLYSLSIILHLRNVNAGGLNAALIAFVFTPLPTLLESVIYGLNYIFNLSFVLIAELFATVTPEAKWFYYSILPLPSSVYDMTIEFDEHMRFRKNIPYSGFGYALLYLGLPTYFCVVFLISVLFLLGRRLISRKRDMIDSILCYSFFVFPFLISLQYNLRTTTRLAYLAALLYVAVSIARRIKVR